MIPDLDNFRKKLEAELKRIGDVKVPVELDIDTAKLRAQLAAIREKLHVPVEFDANAAERALASRKVKVPAELDEKVLQNTLDHVHLRAKVEADTQAFLKSLDDVIAGHAKHRSIKIPVDVEVDQNRISRAFSEIGRTARSNLSQLRSEISSALAAVGSGVTSIGSGLGAAFTGVGKSLAGLVPLLTKVALLSPVIAEAGAAITVAWGAASTAIAAVPALIGAIAVPLGAVMLGMDGIERAAKKIKPQFDALKKSVSDAFERGLTPVLQKLANELFPKLQVGLSATADSLSFVASELTNFVTQGRGLELLSTLIGNVNQTIREMAPGLVSASEGFLRLAGNKAALDVLRTAVDSVGQALNAIADNPALNEAFKGLSGLVAEVTNAFTNLVNNGIKVFAAAAPGATEGLRGISDFFSKFDWTTLGTAAGNAIRGLGSALGSIPQSTVDAITASFQKLGTTLNSPEFASGLQALARLIPPAVTALDSLVGSVSRAATELDNFLHPLEALDAQSPRTQREMAGLRTEMDRLAQGIANNTPGIEKDLGKLPPILQQKVQAMADAIRTNGPQVTTAMQDVLTPLGAVVRGEATKVPEIMNDELGRLPGIAHSAAGKTVGLFGTGIGQLSPKFIEEIGGLGTLAEGPQGFGQLPPAAQQSVLDMAAAVDAAIPGLGTAFATGFTALGPLIDTAFAALNTTNMVTGLQGMATAITTNFTALIGPAFTAGFVALGPVMDQGFLTLSTVNMTTGMTTLATAFTTGFTTLLGPAVTAGFLTLGPIFDTAFMLLATTNVTIGMTTLATAFTTGFATLIVPAINAGMLTVGTAFTTGFANLAATAVTPGMATIAAAVTTGMTTVSTAVTTGFTTITTTVTTAMATIATEVQTGMAKVVTTVTTEMANFVKAIADAEAKAVAAMKSIQSAIVAAIDVNALVGVGRQLIEGMANGMIQGIPAVENAARQAVQRAVAAANAEANVGSPSKLFRDQVGRWLTLGQAEGQLDEIRAVEDAARKSVLAAAKAAKDAIRVSDFGFDFNDLTGDFALRLAAEVNDALIDVGPEREINLGGVRVFIGERELTDIVDVRVAGNARRLNQELVAT